MHREDKPTRTAYAVLSADSRSCGIGSYGERSSFDIMEYERLSGCKQREAPSSAPAQTRSELDWTFAGAGSFSVTDECARRNAGFFNQF